MSELLYGEECQRKKYELLCKEVTKEKTLYFDWNKGEIEEVIDSFVTCNIDKYEVICICSENKLIIKGTICIKIHYCGYSKNGLVQSETFTVPFSETIGIGHEPLTICDISAYVQYSDVDLINCNEIYSFVVMSVYIKLKKDKKEPRRLPEHQDFYRENPMMPYYQNKDSGREERRESRKGNRYKYDRLYNYGRT